MRRTPLFLVVLLLTACATAPTSNACTQTGSTTVNWIAVDRSLLCRTKAGESVRVMISLEPAEPLIGYSEVAKEFPPLPDLTQVAIEAKELDVAKYQGKAIDEARLAELRAILSEQAPKAEAREAAIQAAMHAQYNRAYAATADRIEPALKATPGFELETVGLTRSFYAGTATPAALDAILKLDGISGVMSNEPVRAYPD